jgi:uncharacterized protein (DUF433 family)
MGSEGAMKDEVRLTLNEAGYVVGQSRAVINRAVDSGVIEAERTRLESGPVRRIGRAELRFLAIAAQVGRDFTPAARRKIYDAIRRAPAGAARLALGLMEFRLTEVDRGIEARLKRLEEVRAFVDENGAEPVLRNTAVPVHAVAALARGQSVAEIVEDYPQLSATQVEAAIEYAQVYPRNGRPLPTRSLKRLLGDMAAAGVWDLEDDTRMPGPRVIP